MSGHVVILGCGYIGTRIARAALAQGRRVRVCSRSTAKHDPLRELGAEVRAFDASKARQAGPALQGTITPTVIYSVPPLPDVPGGAALQHAAEAALNAGARSFIYLSSAGVYGDKPDNEWIDESTSAAHDDSAMSPYFTDEAAVEGASFAGLRTCILRLAAVYGPGRGVRVRLRAGDYKLLDDGRHYISRIFVEDLVRIVFAAEASAPQGSMYLVGDDNPTPQREYAQWLCKRLGIPLPASVASYAPGMRRQSHRGRRIRNDKLKAELGLALSFPTYLEGEARIEEDERGETVTQSLTPVEPESKRPPFIRHAAGLKGEEWSYDGAAEKMAEITKIGDAVGLTHIGVSLARLAPGQRSSVPHAHSREDELLYVLEGTPDLFADGRLHRLRPGDVAGFPAGTGIAHTLINNTGTDVRVLVVGEREVAGDQVVFPLNPERAAVLRPGRLWTDAPPREQGPHQGKPDAKK